MPNTDTLSSYRERFASAEAAAEYDDDRYAPGTYDSVLWQIEQSQLSELADEFCPEPWKVNYADFACGSGRVLSYLAPDFKSSTGIEISQYMAALARVKSPGSEVICVDITAGGFTPEKAFELVTAFRFILNAEPQLRLDGLRSLRAISAPNATFIINNHANLFSHKAVLAGFHKLRGLGKGWTPMHHYLSGRGVKKLFREAGYEIVTRRGAGLIGTKLASRMSPERVRKIEAWFARSWFARFGSNQMYVLTASAE